MSTNLQPRRMHNKLSPRIIAHILQTETVKFDTGKIALTRNGGVTTPHGLQQQQARPPPIIVDVLLRVSLKGTERETGSKL